LYVEYFDLVSHALLPPLYSVDYRSPRGTPNVNLLSTLEDCINEGDVDKFYEDEDLKKWYLEFVHHYVILCVPDKAETTRRMSDSNTPEDIFQHVTPELEARTIALVVNGHESWTTLMEEEAMVPTGKRKRCVGRWTGTTEKAQKTRLANCTAWSEEGLKFLDDAGAFFERVREHAEHALYAREAQSWYLNEVVAPANNDARANESRKKTRKMMRADDEPANYASLGKWAKGTSFEPV